MPVITRQDPLHGTGTNRISRQWSDTSKPMPSEYVETQFDSATLPERSDAP